MASRSQPGCAPKSATSDAQPSAAWVLSAVREAFEYGVSCGRGGSRLIATQDGLIDGADYVEQATLAALAKVEAR